MNRVFLQSSNWNLRVTLGTRGVCPRSWSMNCPHSMCMLVSFTERSFSVASSCMVVDTFLVLGSGFPVTPVTLSLLLVPIGKKQLQKIWGAMHCKPIIVNGKRTICKYIWLWNYHLLHKLLSPLWQHSTIGAHQSDKRQPCVLECYTHQPAIYHWF